MRKFSPLQAAVVYKSLVMQDRRKLADDLMIIRAAHHAKDVKKLHKDLMSAGDKNAKSKKGMSAEEFMNAMMGALGGGK